MKIVTLENIAVHNLYGNSMHQDLITHEHKPNSSKLNTLWSRV